MATQVSNIKLNEAFVNAVKNNKDNKRAVDQFVAVEDIAQGWLSEMDQEGLNAIGKHAVENGDKYLMGFFDKSTLPTAEKIAELKTEAVLAKTEPTKTAASTN